MTSLTSDQLLFLINFPPSPYDLFTHAQYPDNLNIKDNSIKNDKELLNKFNKISQKERNMYTQFNKFLLKERIDKLYSFNLSEYIQLLPLELHKKLEERITDLESKLIDVDKLIKNKPSFTSEQITKLFNEINASKFFMENELKSLYKKRDNNNQIGMKLYPDDWENYINN